MKSSLAVAFVAIALCVAVSEGISTEGFRPGKKHSVISHHAAHAKAHRHSALHDLEETVAAAAAKTKDTTIVDKMEKSIASVMTDIDSLKSDLQNIRSMEESMKASISATKPVAVTSKSLEEEAAPSDEAAPSEEAAVTEIATKTEEATPVEATTDKAADVVADAESYSSYAADEADVDSFLEIKAPIDEMNGDMEDDNSAVPALLMNRMNHHSLIQKAGDEKGKTFGIAGDGSGRTFDIAADGTTIVSAPPALETGSVPSNDATHRIGNDPSFRGVPTAVIDPSAVPIDSSIPGTAGKQWSLHAGGNSTTDEDMVCVCKRNGAPRGIDRVRCKRHPSASPMPTPSPSPDGGHVIQCEHGAWQQGSGVDSGTTDTICIYYPVRAPVQTPVPTPIPTPEDYPPECYDPRNEFVRPHLEEEKQKISRALLDDVLIQKDVEVCGC